MLLWCYSIHLMHLLQLLLKLDMTVSTHSFNLELFLVLFHKMLFYILEQKKHHKKVVTFHFWKKKWKQRVALVKSGKFKLCDLTLSLSLALSDVDRWYNLIIWYSPKGHIQVKVRGHEAIRQNVDLSFLSTRTITVGALWHGNVMFKVLMFRWWKLNHLFFLWLSSNLFCWKRKFSQVLLFWESIF